MDQHEIEDTSDWLGCPTELETCRQFLRMYENEVHELNLLLRKAREDVFGLVQMHADVSKERDQLRAELNRSRADLSDARRNATEIETKSNWELMAMNKRVSELYDKIQHLTGADPRLKLPRS
jgi:uncharacterized coiled-coil DUF342 family protein